MIGAEVGTVAGAAALGTTKSDPNRMKNYLLVVQLVHVVLVAFEALVFVVLLVVSEVLVVFEALVSAVLLVALWPPLGPFLII